MPLTLRRASRLALSFALLSCLATALPAARADDFDLVPIDRSASQAAREELTQARLGLLRARANAGQVTRSVEAGLRRGGEFGDAQRNAAVASTRYNEARRPVLASLRADEEYARLHNERETARQVLRKLVDQDKAQYLELLPFAKQALEAGRRMTRSEVIALALDPAVEEARMAMIEAFTLLRETMRGHRETATNHPGITMARMDVEEARARVAEANRRLAEALIAERNAERRRDQRRTLYMAR